MGWFGKSKSENMDKSIVPKDYTTGSLLVDGNFIPPELLKLVRNPEWVGLNNLYNIYSSNPILFAAISIRAQYFSSVEIRVRNIKTGEIYSRQSMREGKITDPIAKKMFGLISEPNPMQSTVEFLTMNSIMHDIFGNSFIRGNFAFNKYDIQYVGTLNNLFPQYIKPKMTGKYLNAVSLKDILENWQYSLLENSTTVSFSPDEILHRKEPKVNYSTPEDIILGESRIVPLQRPLSNISLA